MKKGWKSWLLGGHKKGNDEPEARHMLSVGLPTNLDGQPLPSTVPEKEIMAQYPPVRCLRDLSPPQELNNFVTHPLPLPRELAPLVFCFLSPKDLVSAGSTCHLWYTLTSGDQLWQRFVEKSAGRTESHTFKELFLDLQLENKRRAIRRQNAFQRQKAWRCYAACGMRRAPQSLAPRPKVEPMGFEPSPAWPVHPNSSNELTIKLGFDLIESAKELVSFIRNECEGDVFKDPDFLEWALWRYTRFMQLKAEHPRRFLVPTTEIEFVWQSHLLRPEDYARDVKHVWRVEGDDVMDHRLLGSEADYLVFDEALRETAQLWQRSYGEEYCKIPDELVREKMPVFRDHALSCTIQEEGTKKLWFEMMLYMDKAVPAGWTTPPTGWTSPISLKVEDLIKDSKWFDYFVKENGSSYGFYPEKGWYNLAAKAYERFLYFCYMDASDELAHPTYAIDLMWHTHMLHPKLYREDMVRLTGRMVEHLPWPEHYEEANFTRTNDVWQREFGIPIQEETRKGPWREEFFSA